ncbi:hypothetical protein DXG01_007224 [Tephrocybe rancida]|nr:hypothetical protein DXG01_007224 [Tephrocybe rancida]
MASPDLIDAQFDRAVEIVQSLPKTGPIQTDYEEKLTMYSLYKQATVGNVKTPRPGIWDMLGRAKWLALCYLELTHVLRKYSDKTVAMTLVEELENYGDFTHVSASQTRYRSDDSDTSGSTTSDDDEPSHPPRDSLMPRQSTSHGQETPSEEGGDEPRDLPVVVEHEQSISRSQINRPTSSLSSHKYRTPLTASVAMSPPPIHNVPSAQPRPDFVTPSAFADPSPASSPSLPMSSYVGLSEPSRMGAATPTRAHSYTPHSQYRALQQPLPPYGNIRPASDTTLELAVENVQVHLAALTERMDSLETSLTLSRSNTSLAPRHLGSPRGRHSPNENRGPYWDFDDLGMWSIVLNPVARGLDTLRELATFFARNENRSPTSIIIRRLCLDVSFLVCVLATLKFVWKRSGVRRREVRFALRVLWRAILGANPDRVMMDRGT